MFQIQNQIQTQTQTQGKMKSCKYCGKNCLDNDNYKKHVIICETIHDKSKKENICKYCGKSYKRKTYYNNHMIICEIIKNKDNETEDTKVPTVKELYAIIQDMAVKQKKMEEKIEEMQKMLNKETKNINIVKYLNDDKLNKNAKIDITFKEWTKSIVVVDQDIDILKEDSFVSAIANVVTRNLKNSKNSNLDLPVECFIQKTAKFYIYENDIEQEKQEKEKQEKQEKDNQPLDKPKPNPVWKRMDNEDLVAMLKSIHSKIFKMLCYWRNNNEDLIRNNEKLSEIYNKSIIKLMDMIDCKQELLLNKIRMIIYNILKRELNNLAVIDF